MASQRKTFGADDRTLSARSIQRDEAIQIPALAGPKIVRR